MQQKNEINHAIQVSVPALVQLSRYAAFLPLGSEKILAKQSGDYQSPFKGRGMEFDESRLYQPGDDIRNIDWRVTARSGKTHTKLFREERERQVFVSVDLRSNMFFATRGSYKSVVAANLASLLAWGAIHHGDRVGGLIFSEEVHHEVKPHRGKTGVLRLINQLVSHPSWFSDKPAEQDTTILYRSLVRLRRLARPGSLIFMMSDFRNLDEKCESQLILLSRHTDIVMLFIYDQLEQSLPMGGLYRVSNGQQERILDTYNRSLAERHRENFLAHQGRLNRLSRKAGIRVINCSTQDDPLTTLQTGLGLK